MNKQINELLEVLKEYQELGISEQIDYQKFYLLYHHPLYRHRRLHRDRD